MKTYEITVKAFATLVVSAESEEDALAIAGNEVIVPSGWEHDESAAEIELTTEASIECAIRHSDYHRRHKQEKPYADEE